MGLVFDRLLPLAEGAGLPREYWYLFAADGGTVKVPMKGQDGEQIITVLAFTRRDLAKDYLTMWKRTADFPAGTRVRRLYETDAEARSVPLQVTAETEEGKMMAHVRIALDARMGAERN